MTTESAISWHDNLIYGLHLQAPEPDRNLWHSNLILDIDHIVEWVCGTDGGVTFLVSPATLVFHDVTDLRVSFDFGGDRQLSLNELSIGSIVKEDAIGRDNYFDWRIELNWPSGGKIAFGASGYTQTLRAEPVSREQPRLEPSERIHLLRP
jgi:hypothetical protein